MTSRCQTSEEVLPRRAGAPGLGAALLVVLPEAADDHQTLDGSFSAVSTATIASKDAFFSIFRDLQDLHSFAPLQSQILQIFRNFFRENFRIFSDFCKILLNFCESSAKINKILTQICKNSEISLHLHLILHHHPLQSSSEGCCSWYRHPCLAELRAASTRHSLVGRTATPCNISLIVLVACLFAGAVLFARALLRRGLFVGVSRWFFIVVFTLGIPKVQTNANLVDFEKMLKNASLLAIVAVHTAENEPSKVGDAAVGGRGARAAHGARLHPRGPPAQG